MCIPFFIGQVHWYTGFVYTCIVNWCWVNLYSELIMYTLVVLCTVVQKLILWYLYSKQAFLAMNATHKGCTVSVQSLHTDYTKFVQILQFINSLSASKSNLSWAAHKNLRSACFHWVLLWDPSFLLKSYRVVAHKNLVQGRPLWFLLWNSGLWAKGLGPELDNNV